MASLRGFRRNLPLGWILVRAFFSKPERRRALIAEAQRYLFRSALRAEGSTRAEDVKGKASELFQALGAENDLRQVHHLGALAPLSEGQVSRLDYTLLLCASLLKAKERFRGLGLGSPLHTNAAGNWTGLELAQAWAILSNWSHLFGTFATERAVFYEILRDEGFDRDVVQEVVPELQPSVKRLFESRELHRFFYVTGALRLSRLGNVTPEQRTAWADVWSLLHDDSNQLPALAATKRIYRSLRRLAYLQIHAALGVPSDPLCQRS